MLNTLIILFQIDFIISNNAINGYITHDFDFEDNEIVDFYISFLKSMALRIEAVPVDLFYNEVNEESILFFDWMIAVVESY